MDISNRLARVVAALIVGAVLTFAMATTFEVTVSYLFTDHWPEALLCFVLSSGLFYLLLTFFACMRKPD
ncbi:MAG: hypothetical protein LBM64_09985 [Deltaproteobacteria bacterium]|jgi:uncharacterized integral membrane protein|nr:hypothetical protein [Deltaproteobacteria bacterium]